MVASPTPTRARLPTTGGPPGLPTPFSHPYAFAKEGGAYRCAGCGAELFRADAKFDSGTGWPSFTDPVVADAVELRQDNSHGMVRTEVVCRRCGGHLGHVFDDGPAPTGRRYCINGVCLVHQPPRPT